MIIRPFIVAGLITLPAATALAQVQPPQMPPPAGQQLPAPGGLSAPSSNPDGTVGGDRLEPVQTMPENALPRSTAPGDPNRRMEQPVGPPSEGVSNPVQDQKMQDEMRRQEEQQR